MCVSVSVPVSVCLVFGRVRFNSGQFNVVLTTYTFVMRDKAVLRRLKYQYIIIDEGHRMKNSHCKFSRILGQQYYSRNRVLLTGTPLQNNLPELWSLLNFLLPKVFNSVENFDTWFSRPFQNFGGAYAGARGRVAGLGAVTNLTSCVASPPPGTAQSSELTMEENLVVINRLHQVLRPFLLRRVKSEVLGQLPGKVERVLRCELSAWQRIIYKQLQEHGQMMLDPTSGHTGTKALSNVLMHVRALLARSVLLADVELRLPVCLSCASLWMSVHHRAVCVRLCGWVNLFVTSSVRFATTRICSRRMTSSPSTTTCGVPRARSSCWTACSPSSWLAATACWCSAR